MIEIKPVSDLRNKFSEIEDIVKNGDPVYLTKNGYGTMVVVSMDTFSRLQSYQDMINELETQLEIADAVAKADSKIYTPDEVFDKLRKKING